MIKFDENSNTMSTPKPMVTLSQVMHKLAKEKGIQQEFRMNEAGEMMLQDSEKIYQPSELRIAKVYRFEGDSDPASNIVLYVAEDEMGNKGIIIDSYGAESNYPGDKFDEFLRDIPVEESDEYNWE